MSKSNFNQPTWLDVSASRHRQLCQEHQIAFEAYLAESVRCTEIGVSKVSEAMRATRLHMAHQAYAAYHARAEERALCAHTLRLRESCAITTPGGEGAS